MIQTRVIQGVGSLTCVKLHQPRLAITGSMGLAEKRYHHAKSVAARINDGRAEYRAEANLCGRIDKWKICSGLVNVFNQDAAVRREERRGQITKRLDLLRCESGKRGNLKSFAGTRRQKQQHGEIGLLQRGYGSENVIQQALQFQVAGEAHAEIMK